MSRELNTLKKSVTYVRLPGEDHWLSQSPTRTRMLEELQKFLAAQLGSTERVAGAAEAP
jgi:dipeptidyl aminopeptidase/acylaminoacyl peptidase